MTSKKVVSFLYFFTFWAAACQGRFLAIFFRDLGLTNGEVGYLLAAGSATGLAATPIWAGICDYLQGKKAVLEVNILSSSLCVCLYLLPYGLPFLHTGSFLFSWTLLARCAYSFFFAPVFTILDTLSVQNLEDPKRNYGKCRLWGAVSWGLVNALFLGPLLDYVGSWTMALGFLLASAVLFGVIHLMLFEKSQEGEPAKDCASSLGSYEQFDLGEAEQHGRKVEGEEASIKQRFVSRVSFRHVQVVAQRVLQIVWAQRLESLSFFVIYYVLGIGTSLVEGLVFLFFTQDLGASNFLCGVTVVVTVVFEIPIFNHSDWILKHINVHFLVVIAAVSYIVRVVCYTLFSNPWFVLFVEPLHGVTYACAQLAGVHYAAELAPKGLETSTQGLKDTIRGLGHITGTVLGGIIMDVWGSVLMYRAAAGRKEATEEGR